MLSLDTLCALCGKKLYSEHCEHSIAQHRAARGGSPAAIAEARQRALSEWLRGLGAHYTANNLYGLVHEAAHAYDLELTNFNPSAISVALFALPQRARMEREVVAHAVARAVCRDIGFPLFNDSLGYSERSYRKLCESFGPVEWTRAEWFAANALLEPSARVTGAVAAILAHRAPVAPLPWFCAGTCAIGIICTCCQVCRVDPCACRAATVAPPTPALPSAPGGSRLRAYRQRWRARG